MSDINYKPNSHRFREEQNGEKKRPEKVVKGAVKTKKRNDIRKITDVFISEDINNVKSYVLMEVLVPAIKKAVSDIVTNGIDMILYGETGHSSKKKAGSGYVSYRDYSERRSVGARDVRSRDSFDYDDLIFESRGDAELVLRQMYEILDMYGVVTVGDLFDMAHVTAPYTAEKYGWMSLSHADVKRTVDGYVIKLPRAMPID